MGLFKFIKDAGAKLFGGGAQAATPDALAKTVEGHGFDASKLNIDVQGDRVKWRHRTRTWRRSDGEARASLLLRGRPV